MLPERLARSIRAKKDFLALEDFTGEELSGLLDYAAEIKKKRKEGVPYAPLSGKSVACLFFKNSTRTRVSFETAVFQLGGQSLYMNARDMQLGRGETLEDTGHTLERYVDAVVIRTFAHDDVLRLSRSMKVPVINGLTDYNHPCQLLADLLTVREHRGKLSEQVIAYVGDGNNLANTWVAAAGLCKQVRIASPAGYEVKPAVLSLAPEGGVKLFRDPVEAVSGADVIYTDTWVSMGDEANHDERLAALKPFQVNATLLSKAKPGALFLHCLPAHRGEEVTDEVLDGPQSAVFDQAENRLHVQKAVLAALVGRLD